MELRVLGMVLAGGKGSRLAPLTNMRAKPAVPFGGKYRIVDFVLSNLVNSGIHSIYVLVQFRSQSLLQHLRDGWQFDTLLKNQFIIPVPAQMRTAQETWYRGTADAIYQNANLIEQSHPDIVVLFGADHVYRMDIREMMEFHLQRGSQITVAAIPVHKKFAKEFGVIEVTPTGRIMAFHEKKADAPTMPGRPDMVLASMGNYVFSADLLVKMVNEDAEDETSSHDFGTDILPKMIHDTQVFAYDFSTNRIPGELPGREAYWRDVGTIDAFYEANMDIRSHDPALNLYNRQWPLRTASYATPPVKFEYTDEGRQGVAIDSMVSSGCIISGSRVQDSILGRNVVVQDGALIEDSVIFDSCTIGRNSKIRRAIIEKNINLPEETIIGHDAESDRQKYVVTESGIVVVEGYRSPVEVSVINI